MENINFGHILAWILAALALAGYFVWHQIHDFKTKKRAEALRQIGQAKIIKITDIKIGRYGVDAFIFEYEKGNCTKGQERFVPRTFLCDIGAISIEIGESANLYAETIKEGEPAWLEVRDYKFWGYIGPRIS